MNDKTSGPPNGAAHEHAHGGIFGERTELIFALLSGAFLAVGFAIEKLVESGPDWAPLACYVSAYFFGGFYTLKEAIDNARARKFKIDSLMLVAATGAAILGEFAEGALLLFLFSIGHALENYAMGRAKRAIDALAELAPDTATLLRAGEQVVVPVEELVVGDVVLVRPNERLAADGFVIDGQSAINQAPVTGESIPVDKRPVSDPAPYAAPAAYYFPAIGRMQAVEVTKGAAAIRYGPRTIGGAVNLRSTDIPADGLAGYAFGQYGSRDYYQGQAWVGGDTDYVGALLETYQQGSDGFKTIDGLPDADTGFERQDYRGRLAVHTAPDAPVEARLEFVYGRSDLEANETYLGLADTDFAAEPYRRYAASQRDAFSGEHDQYRVTGSLAFSDGTRITATLYRNDFARSWSKLQDIDFDGDGSFDSISSVFVNPEDNAGALSILRGADSFEGAVRIRNNNRVYRSEGAQISLERPFEMGGARHNLAVSVRYHEDEEDRLQNEEFYSQIGGDLVFERQTDLGQQANREAKAKAIAFYIEDRIEIGALTLTPGLRYEGIDLTRLDYAGSDPDRSNGPTRVRQTNIDQWLPGLGATYELGDAILLAGVSRGFSPPGPGNPDARAEESWNYEAGVRYRSDKVQVSAIGFYNQFAFLLGPSLNFVLSELFGILIVGGGGVCVVWGL